MSEEEQEQRQQQQKRDARPVSMIAQSFAADLDSMFGLTPEVESLTKTVEEKKQTVSSGERELQELEARLREAEERLAWVSRHNSPSRVTESGANDRQAPEEAARSYPLAQKPSYPADRPPTSEETTLPLRESRQPMVTGMANGAGIAQHVNGGGEYAMSQRGYG